METGLEIYGKTIFERSNFQSWTLNWIGKTTTRNGREEHHIANEEFKKRESDKEWLKHMCRSHDRLENWVSFMVVWKTGRKKDLWIRTNLFNENAGIYRDGTHHIIEIFFWCDSPSLIWNKQPWTSQPVTIVLVLENVLNLPTTQHEATPLHSIPELSHYNYDNDV